jgi:hypothetical protein
MNDAVVSEVLIALFAGLVAFAIMRRGTSRPVELVLWIGLVWVCVLGVTSTHDKQTRELTSAAAWGLAQTASTVGGLMGQNLLAWLGEHQVQVATWVVLVFCVDLLLVVLLHAHREAVGWQPRVRLRDWLEMPRPGKPEPAPARVASGADQLNEQFNRWAPRATAGALMNVTLLLIWSLDVLLPAAAQRLRYAAFAVNRARSRVADRAYGALAEPSRLSKVVDIETLAARAVGVRGWAGDALDQVASAPQLGWISGYEALAPAVDGGIEDDDDSQPRDRRDRLAS